MLSMRPESCKPGSRQTVDAPGRRIRWAWPAMIQYIVPALATSHILDDRSVDFIARPWIDAGSDCYVYASLAQFLVA